MRQHNKIRKSKLFHSWFGIGAFIAPLILSACATNASLQSENQISDASPDVLKMSNKNNDPYLRGVSLVNPYFATSPINNDLFNNLYASLFTTVNKGSWKIAQKGDLEESKELSFAFQGATAMDFLDSSNNSVYFTSVDQGIQRGILSPEQMSKIQEYSTNGQATRIKIKINQKIPWVNKNGEIIGHLSAQDFMAAFKMFNNAIKLSLNRNGYIIDLAGFSYQQTMDDSDNKGNEYLYLTINKAERSPFLIQILTTQFFFPMPSFDSRIQALININTNEDNLVVTPEKPLYIETNGSNLQVRIQKSLVDDVYGWGPKLRTDPNYFSSGAYYISSSGLQSISYEMSPEFFKAAPWLLAKSGKISTEGQITGQIPKVILYYGQIFGNDQAVYNGFLTNELSYSPLVVDTQKLAFSHYGPQNVNYYFSKSGYPTINTLTSFNTNIYDAPNKLKSSVTPSYANFLNQFNTPNALEIRKLLFSLVNIPKMFTIITQQGVYDMVLNVAPYGTFPVTVVKDGQTETLDYSMAYKEGLKVKLQNPYDSNKEEEITPTSFLPLPFSDYLHDIQVNTSSNLMTSLSDFKQKQQSLLTALKAMGYSTTRPLNLNIDTNHGQGASPPVKYYSFYEQLKKAFNDVGEGLIDFNYQIDNQARVSDIFNNSNTEISWQFWGPDTPTPETWLTVPLSYNNSDAAGYSETMKNPDGTVFKEFTNFNGEKTPIYNQGIIYQVQLTNLWPYLFDAMTKSDAPEWMKSLLEYLKTNDMFKDKNHPKVNEIISTTKNVLVISSWTMKNDYNRVMLNNFMNSTYSFFPIDQTQSSPYSTKMALVNPHFDPGQSFYIGNYFREWGFYKNINENPRIQEYYDSTKNKKTEGTINH